MVNGAIGRTNLPRKAENQEEVLNKLFLKIASIEKAEERFLKKIC